MNTKTKKLSPKEELEFHLEFQRALFHLGHSAGCTLREKALEVFNNLSLEERQRFATSWGDAAHPSELVPTRLAKILIVACQGEIFVQYASEATRGDIKEVLRIRRERYC